MIRGAAPLLVLALAACGETLADNSAGAAASLDGTPAAAPPPAPEVPASVPEAPAQRTTDWSGLVNGSASFVAVGGRLRPALFLCDATDAPVALALTMPDAEGRATLVTFGKASGAGRTREVMVGSADPGAGQIHYPLSADGRDIGNVHAVNAGVLDGATVPTVSGVTVDGARVRCRWQPETRVIGLTSRRTVLVTGPADGPFAYRSFDFARRADQVVTDEGRTTRATLTVTRGTGTDGGWSFSNGATRYGVRASRDSVAAAGVEVVRDGQRLLGERFLAFTVAGAAAASDRIYATYLCQDGSRFRVLFDNASNTAELRLAGGLTAMLAAQPTGSGIHYAGGDYDLRGKGPEATITGPDGPIGCRDGG